MINKLFKSTTPNDLLEELTKDSFNTQKAEELLESVDITDKFQDNKTFIHKISSSNKIEAIKWLCSKNIDLDAVDNNGNTALMIASKKDAHETVKTLIGLKANPNIKNKNGRMAIHEAALNNSTHSFDLLKTVTENLNEKDDENKTIVHYIIDAKNTKILNDLFNDGRVNIDNSILFYDKLYESSETLMLFINRGFDVNIVDKNNKTILFYVIKNGLCDLKFIEYLLSCDIDLNHVDDMGNNILLELVSTILNNDENALDNNTKDKLKGLIPLFIEEDIETNVCNKDGENVLTLAVNANDIELLRTLLNCDIDPNILNADHNTALSISALKGQDYIDILFLLLDYGADSNIRDIRRKTIIEKLIDAILLVKNNKRVKLQDRKFIDETQDYLQILKEILANSIVNLKKLNTQKEPYFYEALKYGNLELLKLLVKNGADINQPNQDGLNIIYNYMNENTSFRRDIDKKTYYTNLKTIISMGADVNARDDYGGITLHKAILANDDQTIKILMNGGADINSVDNRGRNILHNSIWKNKVKLFRMIYSANKILLNTPDKFGVLPINYAAFLGYADFVLELIDTGSHVNNPYKKTKYIINFLQPFHNNLLSLVKNTRTPTSKQKISILVENMCKEFEVEPIQKRIENIEEIPDEQKSEE